MTNRILKGENISFKVIPYDKEYIAIVKDFDCGNSGVFHIYTSIMTFLRIIVFSKKIVL